MKRSKLLFAPIIATCAVAPIAIVTSCNQKSEAELIAEAIYKPTELTEKVTISSYIEELKKFNDDDKKSCLIYDLFGFFNVKGWRNLPADKSFTSLYKENKVSIATNITKCNYSINDDKVKVNMLGYVSFIFNEDLPDGKGQGTMAYHKNNYVMITYDILNREVKVDEDNCCLVYEPEDKTAGSTECVGMIKELRGGESAVSKLYYLKDVNPASSYTNLPANFKNMSK